MVQSSISVIVPCYNEGKRIIPVINAIKESHTASEIIIVDDGSDSLTKKILENIKGIKLITHSQNKGKTRAMKTGLDNSSGEIIVFIDSDLKGLLPKHIRLLIQPLSEGYDMTLGNRQNEALYTKICGFSIAFTGDRAIRRKLLTENAQKIFSVQNYQVEGQLNKILFHDYKVKMVSLKGVGQYSKSKKFGFFKGYAKDIKMFHECLINLGPKELTYQMFYALFKSIWQNTPSST